jgi:hypothetical protein
MIEQAYRNIEVVLWTAADSLEPDRADNTNTAHDAKPGVETHGGVNDCANRLLGRWRHPSMFRSSAVLATVAHYS